MEWQTREALAKEPKKPLLKNGMTPGSEAKFEKAQIYPRL